MLGVEHWGVEVPQVLIAKLLPYVLVFYFFFFFLPSNASRRKNIRQFSFTDVSIYKQKPLMVLKVPQHCYNLHTIRHDVFILKSWNVCGSSLPSPNDVQCICLKSRTQAMFYTTNIFYNFYCLPSFSIQIYLKTLFYVHTNWKITTGEQSWVVCCILRLYFCICHKSFVLSCTDTSRVLFG